MCGYEGEYVRFEAPLRENYLCGGCGASLRYRLQARAIAAAFGWPDVPLARLVKEPFFRELVIYEPGMIGPFRYLLMELPGYLNSYYWPDVALGEVHEGIRCEDLRSLTFADESMDLVVSSDIFEHVRGPMQGFAELFRVLRPGGCHIFTVPLLWPLPSITKSRVDYSGPEDLFLDSPEYH